MLKQSKKAEILKIFNKRTDKTIVLPEAGFSDRIVKAGIECAKNKIANIVFLVKKDSEVADMSSIKNIRVVNILKSDLRDMLATVLSIKRASKGMTLKQAEELIKDPIYFATMMLELGLVDGLVCGAETSTANTLRPALQIIKAREPESKVSSFFFMTKKERSYLFADCGLNENPNAEELSNIAYQSFTSARDVCKMTDPKLAFLSYSTKGSAGGDSAIKSKSAYDNFTKKHPKIIADGELQVDAAIVPEVARSKAPKGKVKGEANVLIFPDLQSGNIGYKLVERLGGFKAFGPICQGFKRPVNDVSRGASVEDIINVIAITAIQAQQ